MQGEAEAGRAAQRTSNVREHAPLARQRSVPYRPAHHVIVQSPSTSLALRCPDGRGGALVACRDVSRFFGLFAALRQLSLQLPARYLLALLGPNGAGKSTLLRILAGALRPSSGEVRTAGAAWGSPAARRLTGFLAHESFLHPSLTVLENLRYYAALYALPAPAPARALATVHAAHLAAWRVGELSQGMRQKAALARSLLHEPRVLLLDEPFASLDRATVAELQTTLAELRDRGMLLIVSTHTEELIAGLADGWARLERGRIAAADPSLCPFAATPEPDGRPGGAV